MTIHGVDGMSEQDLRTAVACGGRLVMYKYCISLGIVTFKRGTDVYFIQPGKSAVLRGLPFSALSFVMGWWGIPWGPIYTIESLWTNFTGGEDVTSMLLSS